ncbi:MAG: TIGR02757 family protein [Syntrophobacteraceae bacterium]|nr:TIGR02757 family protein [Desulfobacteraceae bacterium]
MEKFGSIPDHDPVLQDTHGARTRIVPSRTELERLYARYNRREFIHPDPLEFVYHYRESPDREIAGIVAALLAYGRVRQILKSVSFILERMGPSPRQFLMDSSKNSLLKAFKDFKHRFTTGEEVSALLVGLKRILKRHGSLEACFLQGMKSEDSSVLAALGEFSRELGAGANPAGSMFLPTPERGSACKRWNLFLRWMVRSDEVDPGVWKSIPSSSLIVPLDTHMHRIALGMKLTSRKQADMRTALEITSAFRKIVPDDPVRYDFSLTRLGIRDGLDA